MESCFLQTNFVLEYTSQDTTLLLTKSFEEKQKNIASHITYNIRLLYKDKNITYYYVTVTKSFRGSILFYNYIFFIKVELNDNLFCSNNEW